MLCFAHRAEAATLISDGFSSDAALPGLLYRRGNTCLLITGEGIEDVSVNLSRALTLKPEVTEIINIGTALHLRKQNHKTSLKTDNIYPVRTAYSASETGPGFKSFTAQYTGNEPYIDVITSRERILTGDSAVYLSEFADAVDREIWAVGYVAEKFRLPFSSYKLLLKLPSENENNSICEKIQNSAAAISDRFAVMGGNIIEEEKPAGLKQKQFQLPAGFYASVSQQNRLDALLPHLLARYSSLEEALPFKTFDRLRSEHSKPKQRTTALINLISDLLNPYAVRVRESVSKCLPDNQLSHLSLDVDRQLEKTGLEVRGRLADNSERDRLIDLLRQTDIDHINSILNGEENEI